MVVEGQPVQAAAVTNVPTMTKLAAGPSNGGLVNTPFTTLRKSPSVNVKLVEATMNVSPSGKPSFSTLGQTFVEVTEATVNVTFIKHAIQQKWGK